MADEKVIAVAAYAVDGRLVKQPPRQEQLTAYEANGRLFRTEREALGAAAADDLNALLLVDDQTPRTLVLRRLLENAREIAGILTAYADATKA